MSDGHLEETEFSGDSRQSTHAPGHGTVASSGGLAAAGAPARRSRLGLVPADYAEKTMNSLLSLHEGLMAEKERALDLTRRLDAVQQDRAELSAYVRLLEVELARSGGPILGAAREEGPSALKDSVGTLLRVLATPGSPRGGQPSRVTPASPWEPDVEAPLEAVSRPPVSRPEMAGPPRPPRPSAAYRAPTGLRDSEVAPASRPTPLCDSDDHLASFDDAVSDEGWRQW